MGLAPGLLIRSEAFGALVYVPDRDRFFALDHAAAAPLAAGAGQPPWAAAGIMSGFLGHFDRVPEIRTPMVVNCFATAHCPLRCRYCHAHDLMAAYQLDESAADLPNVARMAAKVPAMV